MKVLCEPFDENILLKPEGSDFASEYAVTLPMGCKPTKVNHLWPGDLAKAGEAVYWIREDDRNRNIRESSKGMHKWK